MSGLGTQVKWQFILLQKNNIVSISLAVTAIYGLILFFLKGVGSLDKLLVSLVLNDPSVIGFYFIALAIYTEIKFQILPAVFITPMTIHRFLISKLVAVTVLGAACSLGLVLSVKGLDFNIFEYVIGATGICVLSALLGIIVLTFASEYIHFVMISVPVFLLFINLPLVQYLGVVDLGPAKYLMPLQGAIDLIDFGVSGTPFSPLYAYISIVVLTSVFYWVAWIRFKQQVVCR